MTYTTFTRTWWADDACTIPEAGERDYSDGDTYDTQDEAREACREYNEANFPKNDAGNHRGPRGLCMEYEED